MVFSPIDIKRPPRVLRAVCRLRGRSPSKRTMVKGPFRRALPREANLAYLSLGIMVAMGRASPRA